MVKDSREIRHKTPVQHFVRRQVWQVNLLAAAQRANGILCIVIQSVGSLGRIEVRPAMLVQKRAWELGKAYWALTLLSRLLESPL